jgi:transcription initiation factor IIF auxiliary subunit
VEYTLHRSFPNPVRTVCTRQNNFELKTDGWGIFTIPIKVLFKDNTTLELSHELSFTR